MPQTPIGVEAEPNRSVTARAKLLEDIPVTERRLNASGIPTAVLEGGNGSPIVLLHGHGEFAATWKRVIPKLVHTHRIIAPDLPGHGATGLPASALDKERTLAWLRDVIDQTCDVPPAVAGHLLGGAIALRYASKPRAAPCRGPAGSTGAERRNIDAARIEGIRRLVFIDTFGLDWLKPSPRIHVPTRLIWGRYDAQVSLRIAEAASEKYGWPLEVIENAADDPAVEQPAAFLRALYAALGE